MSVDNTTLYLNIRIVYFVRATYFDLIRSSSVPPIRQSQEFFMFHCIVRSQMLTRFCYIFIYLYTKILYFVRATCFNLIRSSSGPPRRQIKALFMYHCILGSESLQVCVIYIFIYSYTKIVYFVRATNFGLIRSSSGPPRRQIQELSQHFKSLDLVFLYRLMELV